MTGTLHEGQYTLMIISCLLLLRMRNASKYRKLKHAFHVQYFSNPALYAIMCKNTLDPGRPQITRWRMRIACWIAKATSALLKYVTIITFPLQQLLQERASMLCFRYNACLVFHLLFLSQYEITHLSLTFQCFPTQICQVCYKVKSGFCR